jgi:hypothetical protein
MGEVNPYQSPLPYWPEFDTSQQVASCPAVKCPNCDAAITFWTSLKQLTPIRFKCPKCRTKFKVLLPFVWWFLTSVSVASAMLPIGVLLGMELIGPVSLLVTVPLLVAGAMTLELWCHRYITRRGRFVSLVHGDPAGLEHISAAGQKTAPG